MKASVAYDPRITAVQPHATSLVVELVDGRRIEVPSDWFPALASASAEELARWEIRRGGARVEWPDLGVVVTARQLLAGAAQCGYSLEDLRLQREAVLELAAARGARCVRVLGSVARGDAGPGSDVDLLVDMEPGRGLLDLAALQDELTELLGRRVDVVPADRFDGEVRKRILREAVAL